MPKLVRVCYTYCLAFVYGFAYQFVSLLISVSKGCQEVRLVFDRYITQSLKLRARSKRTSENEVKFKIPDTSNISNISLKQLLAHLETEEDELSILQSIQKQQCSVKVSDFPSPKRKLHKPTSLQCHLNQ